MSLSLSQTLGTTAPRLIAAAAKAETYRTRKNIDTGVHQEIPWSALTTADRITRRPRRLCELGDPELFFPEDENPKGKNAEQITQAKQVCRNCPFLEGCYTEALADNRPGIWGGTTTAERQKANGRAARRRKLARKIAESMPHQNIGAAA